MLAEGTQVQNARQTISSTARAIPNVSDPLGITVVEAHSSIPSVPVNATPNTGLSRRREARGPRPKGLQAPDNVDDLSLARGVGVLSSKGRSNNVDEGVHPGQAY